MENKRTVDLEKRSQYEMLGCYHDTSKLIYVKDVSTLKSAPKQVEKVPHFLWQDRNFSKGSSFPELLQLKVLIICLKLVAAMALRYKIFSYKN